MGLVDTHLDRIDGLYEAAALLAIEEERQSPGPLGQDPHSILSFHIWKSFLEKSPFRASKPLNPCESLSKAFWKSP